MRASTHQVDHYEIGADGGDLGADLGVSVGNEEIGEDGFPQGVELGADGSGDDDLVGEDEVGAAVSRVIETARDNRQPAPLMKAVDVEAPVVEDTISPWFADIAVVVGEMVGAANPFPLMTKLLIRFGAGQEKPRYVRVDTEESYPGFLAEISPDLSELRDEVSAIADSLEDHILDPDAHGGARMDALGAIDEAEALGARAKDAEARKAIDLWLPERLKKYIKTWCEGDFICASITLPGADGEVRICTSMTPIVRAVEEMEQHAAVANVSAATVVGVLPAMGCVLGAGTLVKEMAAAAPALLSRPEASQKAPFVCRIEPKANPALCAFVALAQECARGDRQACAEWDMLAQAAGKSAPHVAQAMREGLAVYKQATRS